MKLILCEYNNILNRNQWIKKSLTLDQCFPGFVGRTLGNTVLEKNTNIKGHNHVICNCTLYFDQIKGL